MFDTFNKKFGVSQSCPEGDAVFPDCASDSPELSEASFAKVIGAEFLDGMYRLHSSSEIEHWNGVVGMAFPEYASRILCFGCDWLGRQFALDWKRVEGGRHLVLMFEPGTGQVLEIPVDFFQFHNVELIEYHDACLASGFFADWLAAGNKGPRKNQCIGYVKPLYLGGADTLENLECIDLDVYWHVSARLINRVRNLPVGTRIGDVKIE